MDHREVEVGLESCRIIKKGIRQCVQCKNSFMKKLREDTNYNLQEDCENCKWWSINGDRIFNNQHRRRAQALE